MVVILTQEMSGLANLPIIILKEGTSRATGREAQHANISAAKIISESVKSSLGPKGMDKMLVESFGDITITNDGATILDKLDVEHPAAKMMVEVAKTQDDEVGDGTTTAVVLTGELLSKAEELIAKNVHPTVIVDGYRKGAEKALETLDKIAIKVEAKDKTVLREISNIAVASKLLSEHKDYISDIASARALCSRTVTWGSFLKTWSTDLIYLYSGV